MALRATAGLRVLARRRATLAATSAATMLLLFVLGCMLVFAGFFVAVLPADWPAGPVFLLLTALFFLPVAGLVLRFLQDGVHAYTVLTAGPPVRDPEAALAAAGGLGLFAFRRTLRRGWFFSRAYDAGEAAAAHAARRGLPPDHPLVRLTALLVEEGARHPTRAAGRFTLAASLALLAVLAAVAWQSPAHLGTALAMAVPLAVWIAALGAALRGVLGGAWDRYVMQRVAEQAEAQAWEPGVSR